ncbi:MAG: ABC transporter ATP-binding protein/permease [Ruminococcus flavefaciens]|nr:ABC transporter ATP-binding protein/permease [Ruminococcus flavefaciens]
MKRSEHFRIFRKSVKLLFSLSRTYSVCLILNSLIGAALPYVPIWFSARLLDALWDRRPVKVLILYAALTVGIVFVMKLADTYISSLRSAAAGEMYRNEDWSFSEKAMQMAYASIEDPEVTRLLERIRMESQTGYNLFYLYRYMEDLLRNLTQIIMSFSLTASFFRIDAVTLPVKLLLLGGVAAACGWGVFTTRRSEKLNHVFWESCVDMNTLAGKYADYVERYDTGKEIRMYDMQEGLTDFILSKDMELYRNNLILNVKRSLLGVTDEAVSYLLRFAVYMILIGAAAGGDITVGSIAQYVSCMMLMMTAFTGTVTDLQTASANNHYLKRYFSYFEIPNNMYQGTLTVEKRDDNEYFVEFRDVSFRYPNAPDYALRHVSLKFRIGEKLAVVGVNGSGKTTFIKLLCRLYDPTEGVILLNGVDIRKYDYEEYLSVFSVVFQDFRLFSFRLGQNVAAGPEYDAERVKRCLRQARMGERPEDMPKGLETFLYKDFDGSGVEISGGEAQKTALARALYKDAPYIILDEPTAALDPVSEYEVYSSFNQIAGDRTAVYISHRLASCRFCDKIAVFDGGRIVQTGSHEELLSREDGRYYELWQAQAQYYAEGAGAPAAG